MAKDKNDIYKVWNKNEVISMFRRVLKRHLYKSLFPLATKKLFGGIYMKNKIRLIMVLTIISMLIVSGCKIINTTGNMTVMVAHVEERLEILDKEFNKSFEKYDIVALEDCGERLNELSDRVIKERDKFVKDSIQYKMYNELTKVIKYRIELVNSVIIKLENPIDFAENKGMLEVQMNNYINSINNHEKIYIEYRNKLQLNVDKLTLNKYKEIEKEEEQIQPEEINIAYVATRYLIDDENEDAKVVIASVLNVRNGAGMEHEIIGKLIRGTEVEVIKAANEEWSVIQYTPKE